MSSTQEGTTLILASVAVCLLIYVMKQEYHGPREYPRVAGVLGAVQSVLGSNKRVDCSKIKPGNPNWARCAQGSSIGRVPTRKPAEVVKNTNLDFTKDSLQNQGLGVGRLQDDFVHQQFDSSLGASKMGGMRIDKSELKNNAYFSQGTENASSLVASGISKEGAAAFPFSRKSSDEPGETHAFPQKHAGRVPGTEPLGSGMKFADFKQQRAKSRGKQDGGGGGRGASRPQVNKKLGVAPYDEQGAAFNPFVGSTPGSGLGLKEAYEPALGMGSNLDNAFKSKFGSLGVAVSPVKSNVGVSPVEMSEATATLDNMNIVQSTTGGQLNIGIRP